MVMQLYADLEHLRHSNATTHARSPEQEPLGKRPKPAPLAEVLLGSMFNPSLQVNWVHFVCVYSKFSKFSNISTF